MRPSSTTPAIPAALPWRSGFPATPGAVTASTSIPPLYLGSTEEATLELAAYGCELEGEGLRVRRRLTTVAVELAVLDLLNPLARETCAIPAEALRGRDPTALRQLMDVVREREDVWGLLMEYPDHPQSSAPGLEALAILPEARSAAAIVTSCIVEVEFAPPPVAEPSP